MVQIKKPIHFTMNRFSSSGGCAFI